VDSFGAKFNVDIDWISGSGAETGVGEGMWFPAHSKYLPYAFTEHGVLMLSNVLKSSRAIEMSIKIIDAQ
jgi:hypothetical protein